MLNTATFLTGITNSLNFLQANEQSLVTELASGSRLTAISDDPVASGQNVNLSSQISADDSYSQAATSITNVLQVKDSTLSSVVSQLNQAVSIATEGVNGTESGGNLSIVTTQLATIRDEIITLANTQYEGNYVFAGSQGSTQPFVLNSSTDPATVTYQGDTIQSSLTGPDGSSIPVSTAGNQVFLNANQNVLGSLNQLISDFTNGNMTGAQQLTTSLTGLVSFVAQQRATIDNSMNRITAEQANVQTQTTQLTVQQTALLQADTAHVATALSSAETQQSALQDAIAAIEKQGTLFNLITP